MTHIRGLITPLITTHEPASRECLKRCKYHNGNSIFDIPLEFYLGRKMRLDSYGH